MKNVLSIQPHVVFGHAGNSAAVFPMRRLGVNVWPLNTVQFSNHTQYGHWSGSVIDPPQMQDLVEGIGAIGMLPRCDAVLSGYLGTPGQAEAVLEIVRLVKAVNPRALYFCDPVMSASAGSDPDPGMAAFIAEHMPAAADVLLPNHAELQRLAGRELETADEAVAACRELIQRGPKTVFVKQLFDRNSPADIYSMLVVTAREAWVGQRPLYPFARQPVGVGDLTSAVFVACLMNGNALRVAFEHTLAAVNAVMRETWDAGRYELELVAAQNEIAQPRDWFEAWRPDAP
ncbi:pyridoxal kinase PdxY [Paraburkholderia kururiensis]|uniref:pyridoxal kinase PdxY n=1 Tax=Paraburkholderia kururiensis TaxID=984307 RepID=UPI0005AA2FBB|nr:pyridoxal kinase PdxY [Paraburkholderia kururiensis]